MTDPISAPLPPSSGQLWPFSETKGTINLKLFLCLLKDHASKACEGVEVALQSL